MTRDGVKSVVALLKLAYQNYYKDYSIEEMKALIKLWEIQFENYDDNLVADAVNCLISTNKFPPTIADIKDLISKYSWKGLNVHDAWEKVRECSRDCHNKALYDALDDNIKQVMSRTDIIDMGMGNTDNIHFIKSRFIAEYKEVVNKSQEIKKMPIKSISGLVENKLMIENKEEITNVQEEI